MEKEIEKENKNKKHGCVLFLIYSYTLINISLFSIKTIKLHKIIYPLFVFYQTTKYFILFFT